MTIDTTIFLKIEPDMVMAQRDLSLHLQEIELFKKPNVAGPRSIKIRPGNGIDVSGLLSKYPKENFEYSRHWLWKAESIDEYLWINEDIHPLIYSIGFDIRGSKRKFHPDITRKIKKDHGITMDKEMFTLVQKHGDIPGFERDSARIRFTEGNPIYIIQVEAKMSPSLDALKHLSKICEYFSENNKGLVDCDASGELGIPDYAKIYEEQKSLAGDVMGFLGNAGLKDLKRAI